MLATPTSVLAFERRDGITTTTLQRGIPRSGTEIVA